VPASPAAAAPTSAREAGFYPASPGLDAAVFDGAGHSITLHRSAGIAAAAINGWFTGHPHPA
jgi:hypothetical protein